MAKVFNTFLMFLILNLVAYPSIAENIEVEKKLDRYYDGINNTDNYLVFSNLKEGGSKDYRCVLSVGDRCFQVAREGKKSNVYVMDLFDRKMFVWCDTTTQDGGWIVIQSRFNGIWDFNQNWTDYKSGFGLPTADFWYGLQEIYSLSSLQPHELLVILKDSDDNEVYAKYDEFEIGPENEGYLLKRLGAYSGTAGDSLSDHIGIPFSTKDKNNNFASGVDCVESSGGGWWYKGIGCYTSNLNGMYNENNNKKSVTWNTFHNQTSLKEVKMMIRPRLPSKAPTSTSDNEDSEDNEGGETSEDAEGDVDNEIECESGDTSHFGVNKCIYTKNDRCLQVTREGKKSNIYAMKVFGVELFAWCDTKTQGGGWVVIQRRIDGTEDFNQDYSNYIHGFGNLYLELWLGLQKIHFLTSRIHYELLITFKDLENNEVYAHYDYFAIGSEKEGYTLAKLGAYNGTAGDSLSAHVGASFSAKDKDSDGETSINCAESSGGGWWYKNITCYQSNLNGMYNEKNNEKSITWDTFHNRTSLKEVTMMIRAASAIKQSQKNSDEIGGGESSGASVVSKEEDKRVRRSAGKATKKSADKTNGKVIEEVDKKGVNGTDGEAAKEQLKKDGKESEGEAEKESVTADVSTNDGGATKEQLKKSSKESVGGAGGEVSVGTLNENGVEYVKDCFNATREGKTGDVYEIDVPGQPENVLEVWCDTKTHGGSWIVIQRRTDGAVSFNENWKAYKTGFGNLYEEFWFGLENINYMTSKHRYELLISLKNFESKEAFATYDDFAIGIEEEGYPLKRLGVYKGTAGDSLTDHVGAAFSTKDKDNDGESSINCAESSGGGWWYKNITCYQSNLNGMYNEKNNTKSITWYTFYNQAPLKEVTMMIRPIVPKNKLDGDLVLGSISANGERL